MNNTVRIYHNGKTYNIPKELESKFMASHEGASIHPPEQQPTSTLGRIANSFPVKTINTVGGLINDMGVGGIQGTQNMLASLYNLMPQRSNDIASFGPMPHWNLNKLLSPNVLSHVSSYPETLRALSPIAEFGGELAAPAGPVGKLIGLGGKIGKALPIINKYAPKLGKFLGEVGGGAAGGYTLGENAEGERGPGAIAGGIFGAIPAAATGTKNLIKEKASKYFGEYKPNEGFQRELAKYVEEYAPTPEIKRQLEKYLDKEYTPEGEFKRELEKYSPEKYIPSPKEKTIIEEKAKEYELKHGEKTAQQLADEIAHKDKEALRLEGKKRYDEIFNKAEEAGIKKGELSERDLLPEVEELFKSKVASQKQLKRVPDAIVNKKLKTIKTAKADLDKFISKMYKKDAKGGLLGVEADSLASAEKLRSTFDKSLKDAFRKAGGEKGVEAYKDADKHWIKYLQNKQNPELNKYRKGKIEPEELLKKLNTTYHRPFREFFPQHHEEINKYIKFPKARAKLEKEINELKSKHETEEKAFGEKKTKLNEKFLARKEAFNEKKTKAIEKYNEGKQVYEKNKTAAAEKLAAEKQAHEDKIKGNKRKFIYGPLGTYGVYQVGKQLWNLVNKD